MKILTVLLSIIFILSGCTLSPEGPDSINADAKAYKTGFYGTLYPNVFSTTPEILQYEDFELIRISHDIFELYHADVGPYAEGTIYCEESQYNEALAYYSAPENYKYFCTISVNKNSVQSTETIELSNVDAAVFNELLSFTEKSDYDPLEIRISAKPETIELPMPDNAKDIRFVFYKESTDSLFISGKGDDFYIIDNTLYLVYLYDFDHGNNEKLIAVKVPEHISNYFVSLMDSYID